MDGLTHRVVAAEAEADVGDAAGNLCLWQMGANPATGFDEVNRIVIVRFDAGGDSCLWSGCDSLSLLFMLFMLCLL